MGSHRDFAVSQNFPVCSVYSFVMRAMFISELLSLNTYHLTKDYKECGYLRYANDGSWTRSNQRRPN